MVGSSPARFGWHDGGMHSDEAIEEVRRLLRERVPSGQPGFVGIDGLSCSGKTTFATRLATALGAELVHADDLSRAGRPLWEHERFVTEVYAPVLAGREGRYRRWHWTSAHPGEELAVSPHSPVVVEGVHVIDNAVAVPWTVRVWVDVDRDLRIDRARQREGGARWACWSTNWMPREEAYLAERRPDLRADLIVKGV